MTGNRILRYAAIGGGLAVVLGIAVAAFLSLKVPFDTSPSAGPSTGPCEPQPCANMRGYIVWVSDLKIQEGLEFNSGASFGPVPACFRPSSTSPPLGLRWTPDFGAFCCEIVIPLD